MHVHFIGIGGTGLSAIARILLEKGNVVTGSDRLMSPLAKAVEAAGATVFIGHDPANITGADIIVRSSAIPDDNTEVQAAYSAGISVMKRADLLEKILKEYQVIAIAGTHGKTTTTAMIAWILESLGMDPSYIIGSVSINLGKNARAGMSSYFVIEADEYDRMFLGLNPAIAVVTNIEHDHPDCYPTEEEFRIAFAQFVRRLKPDGVLLASVDDAGSRRLSEEVSMTGKRVKSYGIEVANVTSKADYTAVNLIANEIGGFTFDVSIKGRPIGNHAGNTQVALQVPGRHNVSNALAALGVIDVMQLSVEKASVALSKFRGTERRFQVKGEPNNILVIDDYAHHPTEIRATLAAARARYPDRNIWAVWQPHTYSRTRALFYEFSEAFLDADNIIVMDVYAARETLPADGFSSKQIVDGISHANVFFIPTIQEVISFLTRTLKPQDVLLVLSAGDADKISTSVVELFQTIEGGL